MRAHQFPRRGGRRVLAGVGAFEQRVERALDERLCLLLVEHRHLGINGELVKVRAHQFEAETVQGRNPRRVDQRELIFELLRQLARSIAIRLLLNAFEFLAERGANPLPHLGRGGNRVGHQQHVFERGAVADERQATFDQCARLARAGASDHQHVAARADRFGLGMRRRVHDFLFPEVLPPTTASVGFGGGRRTRYSSVHGSKRQIGR